MRQLVGLCFRPKSNLNRSSANRLHKDTWAHIADYDLQLICAGYAPGSAKALVVNLK